MIKRLAEGSVLVIEYNHWADTRRKVGRNALGAPRHSLLVVCIQARGSHGRREFSALLTRTPYLLFCCSSFFFDTISWSPLFRLLFERASVSDFCVFLCGCSFLSSVQDRQIVYIC